MGCDISEQYYFVGSLDGVKKFHDFLKSFECNDEFEAFLNEKYPIDKSKLNDTYIGFHMGVDEIKSSDKLSAFSCSLGNRNSISAFVFKELLDNYFPGVYMYFSYIGDSMLSGNFNTNDREQRFFAHIEDDELETRIEEIYVQNTGIPEPTVDECHALCGVPTVPKYETSEDYDTAEKPDFTAGNSETEKTPEKAQKDSESSFGSFPDDIPF